MNLREMLLKELRESAAKDDALIKQYSDDISTEMFLKSTVTDGLFATSARNACDKRADAALRKKSAVEASGKWKKEMLSKY